MQNPYKHTMLKSLFVLGLSAFVQAQSGQWVDELFMVSRSIGTEVPGYRNVIEVTGSEQVLVDEKNSIQKRIPNVADAIDFPVSKKYLSVNMGYYWYSGALYTTACGSSERNEDGSQFVRWTIARWNDDEWHLLGNFKTDIATRLRVIPCANNRFIVFSNKNLRNQYPSDRTPFYKASIQSGRNELRIDSPIAHGMDEFPGFFSDQSLSNFFHCQIVVTDEHATVIDNKTGLFWIFSLEKASLVKSGTIFKSITPEIVANNGYSVTPIFCIQPEKKENTILINTEEEKVLTDGIDDYYDKLLAVPGLSFEEIQKIYTLRSEDIARRRPFIAWYRLYTENGKVEKLIIPPEGCAEIKEKDITLFFQPMLNGSVKMVNIANQLAQDGLKKQNSEAQDNLKD
ncbi:MAG: hypothetical protein FWG02_11135 [Holophagaceae bacterium]|nr:hypothetical protein [Holophagaceae bacterium]